MAVHHVQITLILAFSVFNIRVVHLQEDPLFCVNSHGERVCHSTDQHPYRFYGSKTRYDIGTQNLTNSFPNRANCKPILFYLLCRHATRLPVGNEIENMAYYLPILKRKIISTFEKGNSSLCQQDIDRLRPWIFSLNKQESLSLSENGEKESIDLARRQKQKFPELLNHSYSESYFQLEYSSSTRALRTAQSYAVGLFGRQEGQNVPITLNDPALKFFATCDGYQERCKTSQRDVSEMKKFFAGPFQKLLLQTVSERLGFTVEKDEVQAMYDGCRYPFALLGDDAWCGVFSQDELKIIGYTEDLRHYYYDGYGNKVNYEQACPVVQYVVSALKTATTGKGPKVILQFSQSSAIKKVFPRFGLFRDDRDLGADTMCYQEDRKWHSGHFSPFITNLALVLYKCGEEHKIMALHNERPIKVGGCPDDLCSLDDFFATYDEISENCDMKRICCPCCKV